MIASIKFINPYPHGGPGILFTWIFIKNVSKLDYFHTLSSFLRLLRMAPWFCNDGNIFLLFLNPCQIRLKMCHTNHYGITGLLLFSRGSKFI